jgi:hypothetical protein
MAHLKKMKTHNKTNLIGRQKASLSMVAFLKIYTMQQIRGILDFCFIKVLLS